MSYHPEFGITILSTDVEKGVVIIFLFYSFGNLIGQSFEILCVHRQKIDHNHAGPADALTDIVQSLQEWRRI